MVRVNWVVIGLAVMVMPVACTFDSKVGASRIEGQATDARSDAFQQDHGDCVDLPGDAGNDTDGCIDRGDGTSDCGPHRDGSPGDGSPGDGGTPDGCVDRGDGTMFCELPPDGSIPSDGSPSDAHPSDAHPSDAHPSDAHPSDSGSPGDCVDRGDGTMDCGPQDGGGYGGW